MRPSVWIWLAVLAAATGVAHAQAYKWVGKDGHVEYGDTPPPGAKATPLRYVPPAPAPTARGSDDTKEVRKEPVTPAEKELDFRRRQKEAQEAAAKADKERQEAEAKKANCASAQQSLRTLESGQRIMRVDDKGERYFINDAQRAQDTARAREAVGQWCK